MLTEASKIPKIIHLTASDLGGLTPPIQQNIEKLKEANPGWRIRLYDDTDIHAYIQDNFSHTILEAFSKINPKYGAARADFFRYLVISKEGGVYLDIKSTALIPLDDVIRSSDTILLSHWNNGPGELYEGWGLHPELSHIPGGEYQQWHLIASAKNPLIEATINRVLFNIENYDIETHGVGQMGVLRVTGPICYTLAIDPLKHLHGFRMIDATTAGLEYLIPGILPKEGSYTRCGAHYSLLSEPVILPSR